MSSPAEQSTVIKITKTDAESQHVDDLLKRQASLRGDVGIARDTGKRWYYQNWFVLMLAGFLSAILCWAILLPWMGDKPYLQGKIEAITPRDLTQPSGVAGNLKLGGKSYMVPAMAHQLDANRKWSSLDLEALKVGDPVGVYVEISPEAPAVGGEPLMYISHIDPNPPAASGATTDLREALHSHQFGFILFFPLAAGMVGLGIGAADGIMCRLPRRIFLAGLIGLVVGLVGGFISSLLANIIYGLISNMALKHTGAGLGGLTATGFLLQITGRSLGWALAGTTMGLGQGLALRSGRVVLYGLLGGLIGGLFGGILFDPIDFLFRGDASPSAHLSRLVSLGVIGLSVGAMIGVVELLARDAWLRMVAGPLAGKEFLIFKNTMKVGASPKSDIYLFNDPGVAAAHATLRATGDIYEIEGNSEMHPITINGRTVHRSRLRHGDEIRLGRTVFVFQRKAG